MTSFITESRQGHLLVVTIERPAQMNALHPPAHEELNLAFDRFAEDEELWVAIVTGAGSRSFCAGNDLKYMATAAAPRAARLPRGGFGGLTKRFDLNKPVIAAVNGAALGGGFEIALACDLVIASENAIFALPEPLVGRVAIAGGVQRLARTMTHQQAMGIILTGRRVSAHEGIGLGFVNEVVPVGEALAGAQRWAEQICQCSPLAVRAAKEIAHQSINAQDLPWAMRAKSPAFARLRESDDFIEGPRAFAERRRPEWSGC